jgi:hypothetical protein
MNAYFFTVSEEERSNILDKHKTLYDGYSVRNEVPNEQPLYVQDFANDKVGVTVKSNGEVTGYDNKIYIKESKSVCSECGLYEEVCECGSSYMGENDNVELEDFSEGDAFSDEETNEGIYDLGDLDDNDKFDYTEEECYECMSEDVNDLAMAEEDPNLALAMANMEEELDFDSEYLDDEEIDVDTHQKLKESLDMFKRFQKYL